MPLYEYECEHCNARIEVAHGMEDKPLLSCAECDEGTLRKVFTTGGSFRTVGGGWYKDGYEKKRGGR